MAGMAAIAATVAAGRALAADDGGHMDMNMGSMDMHHEHAASKRNDKLIAAAAHCVEKANICLQHCIARLGRGDTELAACAGSASQVMAICAALESLAAGESRHLPALARAAMDVCKDCEEECKKTDQHPECKACEEACAACHKECQAVAA